jgi:hypothetical protein
VAGEDRMVDNHAVLGILRRVEGTPVRVVVFDGAHHVLPASVPLEDLVERIWHWFTAPAESLERRVALQHVAQPAAAVEGVP